MNVAILTQPLRTNYGGILQAYALQTFLQKRGHNVIVVNREYNNDISCKLFFWRVGSMLKSAIKLMMFRQKEFIVMNPLSPYYHSVWSGYDVLPFVEKYINHSDALYSSKSLREFFRRQKFDAFIVGSDQVWRPRYSPCITDFFLKEIPKELNAVKVAYAASFGTDRWEFTEEETKECASLAKLFDAVSVREKSGVKLCKEYLGINAEHLIDPTMLLYKEDYINLMTDANLSKSKGNLFCYMLDDNYQADLIVESLKEDGYKLNYASTSVVSTNETPRSYQLSVEEWLRGIYDAEIVVTDSFHACVFSILFNRPFVVVGNASRGNTRFDSLLEMFELQGRKIESYARFIEHKACLLKEDDLYNAQTFLSNHRLKSMDFWANLRLEESKRK